MSGFPQTMTDPDRVRPKVEVCSSTTEHTTLACDLAGHYIANDLPIESGDRINQFVVERKLAEGGMGVVWLARDTSLDRPVAIKVLLPRVLAADGMQRARARLLQEAKAIARVDHPNIVTVFEVGTIGPNVYVAMEYMAGGTLRTWLRERLRSEDEVLEVFRQVAAGLHAAHEAGLVHRDVKPENILLGRDGRAVISDFGLVAGFGLSESSAVAEPIPPQLDIDSLVLTPTRTGVLKGTPAYMAPEQFIGDSIDSRADQFAFAVTLFEALYGERPYPGKTYEELCRNLQTGTIVVTANQSAEQRAIMLRALRLRPEERFHSVRVFMNALLAARQPLGVSPRRWLAGGLVAAIAAVVAMTLLVFTTQWQRGNTTQGIRVLAAPPAGVLEHVTITLSSEPPGAAVHVRGEDTPIANTPASLRLNRQDAGRVEYVVKRNGYRDAHLSVSARHDAAHHVRLRRFASVSRGKSNAVSSLRHAKRTASPQRAKPTNKRRIDMKRRTASKPVSDVSRAPARKPKGLGLHDLVDPRL